MVVWAARSPVHAVEFGLGLGTLLVSLTMEGHGDRASELSMELCSGWGPI